MTISPSSTVADIATQFPLATRVFARHSVDFCCGGHEPLAETCETRGLNLEQILAELEVEIREGALQKRWDEAPIPELVQHILDVHHAPLAEELARIESMARKVHNVHGDKDIEMFDGILNTFLAIRAEVEPHLITEEEQLFPEILAGRFHPDASTMGEIEKEHEVLGELLRTMRRISNDFVVPMQACNTWRALLVGLEALESDFHRHIHLENHVLFPRVRAQSNI